MTSDDDLKVIEQRPREIRVFQSLAKKYPDNPLYLYHYGLALFQSAQTAKAQDELEAALPKRASADRKNIETTLAKTRQ